MKKNDLGAVVSPRRWSISAIDCYKRGCVCQGCLYYNYFENTNQKCQMKATVLELIRLDIKIPHLTDLQQSNL